METVLIIDDNSIDRRLYYAWLSGVFNTIESPYGKNGFDLAVSKKPFCIVLDKMMSDDDGLHFLFRFPLNNVKMPPIILVTGELTEATKRNAIALGAAFCFDKNTLTKEVLLNAINSFYPKSLRKMNKQ